MPEQTLTFDWSNPTTSERLPPDTLNRARYASFLHNYLVDVSKNGGYVLNLNASWGAGKTFFIKRWLDSIEDTHPVVYIDAWKQDYSDDPMLTVVSSLIDALKCQLPPENQSIDNIVKTSAKFLKTAAPILTRALFKKATGIDIHAFSDTGGGPESEQLEEVDSSEAISESAAKLAKCLVDEHNEKLHSIQYLREQIEILVTAVISHKNKLKSPAFVFIDELDRCRPSYAVEMLEVVKHFFELDNIVFVVATDTEQLQHTVKAVYGKDFDAKRYLGRFFRRRYTLTPTSLYAFSASVIEKYHNKESVNLSGHTPYINGLPEVACTISTTASMFSLSLRDTEQLVDKFLSVLSNTEKTLSPHLLLILFVLYEANKKLYEKWIEASPETSFKEAISSMGYSHLGFYIDYHENMQDLVPIDAQETIRKVKIDLCTLLETANMACSEYDNAKKTENYEWLELSVPDPSGYEDSIKISFQQSLFNLKATKADYKNWVELAISFDQ
ncbi:P-loop NTPase fold protein [Salinivibrio sp. KP-1]|uniref:KAP family P-loop NTPase fold protein n=1 Tax=Salinivibrio sp. KP-1 TaxID=1406902 RepID=UPI0006148C19|nr:P-loop NTPase fold protein [Salinivibrio sp. KP-1]KKA43468.1 hypothetical protein WN56_13895 [Salinivibrio sp. KP-1]